MMPGAQSDHPPPVLVLTAPGCPGQTVAAALGRNPGAYDVPELALELSPLTDSLLREMAGLRAIQMHGLLRTIAQLVAGEQSMAAVDMARRWLARRSHLPTARLAHEIAALIAPRRMIRPVSAALLDPGAGDRLCATFPQARILRLHRHPLALGEAVMAESGGAIARMMGARERGADGAPGGAEAPPDPQELWLMAEAGADAICARIPQEQVRALRIEDLLADPASVMRDLGDWLGLPVDTAAVAAMQAPEASAFAGIGPFGAHMGGEILPLNELDAGPAGLNGPLPWRSDSAGFHQDVRKRAAEQGYS